MQLTVALTLRGDREKEREREKNQSHTLKMREIINDH